MQTENAQPALLGVSIAMLRVLQERGFLNIQKDRRVLGHSAGHIVALAAAGALELSYAAQLLVLPAPCIC